MGYTYLALAPAVLAAAVGLVYAALRDYDVRVPQAAVQQAVDRALPVERGRYAVRAAAVSLRPDGLIDVALDAEAALASRSVAGTLNGTVAVEYREGALYLSDFRLHGASIRDYGLRDREAVAAKLAAAAFKAVGAAAKDRLAERYEMAVEVFRDGASEVARAVIEDKPVFRLKQDDWRHRLAEAAVGGVRVEEGELVVTVSLLSRPGKAVLMAIAGFFGLVAALGTVAAVPQRKAPPAAARQPTAEDGG